MVLKEIPISGEFRNPIPPGGPQRISSRVPPVLRVLRSGCPAAELLSMVVAFSGCMALRMKSVYPTQNVAVGRSNLL